jgi:hypothetical protein
MDDTPLKEQIERHVGKPIAQITADEFADAILALEHREEGVFELTWEQAQLKWAGN